MVQNQSQLIASSSASLPVPNQLAFNQLQASQQASSQQLAIQQVASQPAASQLQISQPSASQLSQPLANQPTVSQPLANQPAVAQPAVAQSAAQLVFQPAFLQERIPLANLALNNNRYDHYSFNKMLLRTKFDSCSLPNYAARLLVKLFTLGELSDTRFNVTGRLCRGGRGEAPQALDVERIEFIRETVLSYVNGDYELKMKTWTSCTKAMNKMLYQIRVKNSRLN